MLIRGFAELIGTANPAPPTNTRRVAQGHPNGSNTLTSETYCPGRPHISPSIIRSVFYDLGYLKIPSDWRYDQ